MRSYIVSGIAKGNIGAQEVHLAHTEIVTALDGKALWTCVDLLGNEKVFTLDGSNVVVVPPGILHTYEALEDDTRLQVIANTLFVPEDTSTHDSYSASELRTSSEVECKRTRLVSLPEGNLWPVAK
jgi:dTDP-4-dehydrorhamnose 3,5-epimerase-like enzyme